MKTDNDAAVLRGVLLVVALLLSAVSIGVSAATTREPRPWNAAKPAQLSESDWVSLRRVAGAALLEHTRLTGDESGPEAEGAPNDHFGSALSVSGDTVLVGVNGDDAPQEDRGSAYIFVRAGDTWTLQAKLVAADGSGFHAFGTSVALSGDTALIGAPSHSWPDVRGSAYVFVRSGDTWSQQAQLSAPDAAPHDGFGVSVALEGDTALVSAPGKSPGGSVYVFVRSANAWSMQSKLVPPDSALWDSFGEAVSISGNSAAIGAPGHDVQAANQGGVYVFDRSGTAWSMHAKLLPSDLVSTSEYGDRFGGTLALSGNTIVIGADQDDAPEAKRGSAYVFVRNGNQWSEQQRLTAVDGSADAHFGSAVALSGESVLVGASLADGAAFDGGSAYLYRRESGAWTLQQQFSAAAPAIGDRFGSSVALSGTSAFVGARGRDAPFFDQGALHVFGELAGTWTERQRVTTGYGAGSALFGYSVDVDGDTALIGSSGLSVNGQSPAYVFIKEGAAWVRQANLLRPVGDGPDDVGIGVAISGDTAAVASYADRVASASVFVREQDAWVRQSTLAVPDDVTLRVITDSIAASGDTVVIGGSISTGFSTRRGCVLVFERTGTQWTLQARLDSGVGGLQDQFGYSVALSQDTLVVGDAQGAAYAFTRTARAWSAPVRLSPSASSLNDRFGISVAVEGDTALVGADFYSEIQEGQGAVFVFRRTGSAWSEESILLLADARNFDRFGSGVALSGGIAVVGAIYGGTALREGAAYVFSKEGGSWRQSHRLMAEDGLRDDQFGTSVAVSGDTAVVGAPLVDNYSTFGNPNEGAAYLFNTLLDAPLFVDGFEP